MDAFLFESPQNHEQSANRRLEVCSLQKVVHWAVQFNKSVKPLTTNAGELITWQNCAYLVADREDEREELTSWCQKRLHLLGPVTTHIWLHRTQKRVIEDEI